MSVGLFSGVCLCVDWAFCLVVVVFFCSAYAVFFSCFDFVVSVLVTSVVFGCWSVVDWFLLLWA